MATYVAKPFPLMVINVHLVHNDRMHRGKQLDKILSWLNDNWKSTPTDLCGDFNVDARAKPGKAGKPNPNFGEYEKMERYYHLLVAPNFP